MKKYFQNGITVNDCQAIDEKSPTETYSEDVLITASDRGISGQGISGQCIAAQFPNSVDQALHNRKFTSHGPHAEMTINNLAKKTIIEALNK